MEEPTSAKGWVHLLGKLTSQTNKSITSDGLSSTIMNLGDLKHVLGDYFTLSSKIENIDELIIMT